MTHQLRLCHWGCRSHGKGRLDTSSPPPHPPPQAKAAHAHTQERERRRGGGGGKKTSEEKVCSLSAVAVVAVHSAAGPCATAHSAGYIILSFAFLGHRRLRLFRCSLQWVSYVQITIGKFHFILRPERLMGRHPNLSGNNCSERRIVPWCSVFDDGTDC